MPIEFIQPSQPTGSSGKNLFKLTMSYDGSGRRISKTRWVKNAGSQDWEKELVTHYTGIGTEIREDFSKNQTKVVVNMLEGFGRYGVEDASGPDMGFGAGYIPNTKFEWYLKNHLGSTMLVYGTQANAAGAANVKELVPLAAYDYRAFGEMVELTPPPTDKVTENFTGSRFARRTQRTACMSIAEPKNLGAKRNELDDEISLDYFGARYLDPMLGMWTSVDPARQFASPYLYAGNGVNPVNVIDPDGNSVIVALRLGTNVISNVTHIDDAFNLVALISDGSTDFYKAPPKDSYFNTEYLIGKKFDYTMEAKANAMIEDVNPIMFWEWLTDHDYDFKYHFYSRFEDEHKKQEAAKLTVGFLNETIMTARDVGNAIWGGYTRNMYLRKFTYVSFLAGGFTPTKFLVGALCAKKGEHLLMQVISNIAAGGREDHSSAVMQSWGFDNYKP